MVEHVERLKPILQLKALRKPEILEDVQIKVLRPLRALGVAPDGLGIWETGSLNNEYIIRRHAGLVVWVLEAGRTSGGSYDDRSGIVRCIWIPNVRPISSRKTITVSVKTVDDCEWCSRLERCHPGNLPSAQNVSEHTFIETRYFPNVANHQAMCTIVVGWTPVKLKASLKRRY
jgi:hypothetical protein